MRVVLLGNAGAGKSTLAKKLIARHSVPLLSLDEVAFLGGAQRRPLRDSVEDVKRWIADKESWVIEGCYSDIIEPILGFCDELIFLNPGVDACLSHCRSRPWEPEKFGSRQEQDENLEYLLQWVRSYVDRTDEYGLARHRKVYESFQGKKREFNHPTEYESEAMTTTGYDEELFFDNSGSGCFGCSRDNPHGLQLRFFRRGEAVVSPFSVPDRFHGAPEIAHGGIVATLLDEVSCAAAYHLKGDYVVTGELSVRYEKPCPVEVPLEVVGEVLERRPKYWIVEARVERDGDVLARSEGRFFPMERPAP